MKSNDHPKPKKKKGTTAPPQQSAEGRLQAIMTLSSDLWWEQDEQHRLTRMMGRVLQETGIDPQHLLGGAWWDRGAVPVGDHGWAQLQAVLEARQPFTDFVFKIANMRGELRYIRASGQPMFDDEGRFAGYIGFARDITEQHRAEQLLRLEHMVTRCLADADSGSAALQAVMSAICETENWECGEYWRGDEHAGVLRLDQFWISPSADAAVKRFIERSRDVVFKPGVGLSGSVWQSGEPIWISDMRTDQRTLRKDVAIETGLRGAFRIPIAAQGKTIGVLNFSSREPSEPQERLLQAMRVIGSQIGQFLQRKRAEEVQRQSDARFRATFDQAAVGIAHIGLDGKFLTVNDKLCDILGHPRAELMQKTFKDISHPEDREVANELRTRLLAGEIPTFSVEKRYRRHDGSDVWARLTVSLMRETSGAAAYEIAVFEDISARKQAEERIQYLATRDALTALPNRAMFSQVLNFAIQTARRYQRRFAVMFIDLDRFKIINDTLGHEAGDALLVQIGARLKQCLRASDVVARLGGDEFVVLVAETNDPEQVAAVARKLLSTIMKPMVLAGQECRVTGSIGVSLFPEAQDEQTLMKQADMAMYLAKEEGKNNFQVYSKDIKARSLERLALETDLRRALERDEFYLDYQAKLDLKTNAITGAEALLRWRHPDLGVVLPLQFVPLAEETGLIVPIGRWVLKTACAQNVAWQRQGFPPLFVSVNLSSRQFADEDLLKDISAILRDTGMDSRLLELELTESMLMSNVERAVNVLTALSQLGVRLAIDDFGTGYSSLAQIKRFPIDTLKVDRSFVRQLPQNAEDRAIMKAIIDMGKTLSLTIVAEGVETGEQEAFLRGQACDESQGHYFSKPIPPDEFAELLRRHAPLSQ